MADENKPAGGAPETPPAPDPAAAKKEGVTELQVAVDDVKEKIRAGELAGMSESTAHALYEQLKELNANLRELKNTPPDEVAKKVAALRRWLPRFLTE